MTDGKDAMRVSASGRVAVEGVAAGKDAARETDSPAAARGDAPCSRYSSTLGLSSLSH